MKQEVAEYLMYAYKGELAIREADKGKVKAWAQDTAHQLVERLKEQIGEPDKPVFYTNAIGQVKEKKRKVAIPEVIGKFVKALGGTFDDSTYCYTLPETIGFENGLTGAKILMERAFEHHMFPKAMWNFGAIVMGFLTVVSIAVVMLRPNDWMNYGIMLCLGLFFAFCTFKTLRHEKFTDVAKSMRERVIRSRSIPE